MFYTHPKVVDPCVGDLVFDPVKSGVVARAVLLLRQTQVKHFDHYRETQVKTQVLLLRQTNTGQTF